MTPTCNKWILHHIKSSFEQCSKHPRYFQHVQLTEVFVLKESHTDSDNDVSCIACRQWGTEESDQDATQVPRELGHRRRVACYQRSHYVTPLTQVFVQL